MNVVMRFAIFASLVIASTVTARAQTPVSSPPTANVSVLKLKSVNDKKFAIENARGRVVVASFGATWCVPCVIELQALEELKREYKGKPIDFLWVSIDDPDTVSDTLLRHYIKERKLTMPVLRDETRAAFANFATRTRLPLVVVFDADGKVTTPLLTGMSEPEPYKSRLRARLDTLLLASEDKPKTPREASTRR